MPDVDFIIPDQDLASKSGKEQSKCTNEKSGADQKSDKTGSMYVPTGGVRGPRGAAFPGLIHAFGNGILVDATP